MVFSVLPKNSLKFEVRIKLLTSELYHITKYNAYTEQILMRKSAKPINGLSKHRAAVEQVVYLRTGQSSYNFETICCVQLQTDRSTDDLLDQNDFIALKSRSQRTMWTSTGQQISFLFSTMDSKDRCDVLRKEG